MTTSLRATLAALAGILIAAMLAACAGPTAVRPHDSARGSHTPPNTVILVSIDAFRPDYLDRGISPTLSRLVRDGVRAQWMTPSYPSLTFPNHWSIVTGLRPDHSGIVHNTMRDAMLGGFKMADLAAVDDGRWWGGEPIWAAAEKAGIRTATMFWPGSSAEISGVRPSQWRPFDKKVTPEARVDTVLGWLDAPAATQPRLVTLYFDEVDEEGHDHGPASREVDAAIASVDAAMARLVDGLRARGQLATTDIIVVSDHGMATVAPGRLVVVEDMVSVEEAVVVTVGQVVGIAPNPGFEATVEQRLVGRHAHYACWRKGDLPPRWKYGTHPRIPPIVCQMDEGWDALARDVAATRPTDADRGSHGYDPALPSMRALFIASGPSFTRGAVIAPFDNVDVYPLLARLLGVPPAPNDGDLAPLLPALRDAAPAAATPPTSAPPGA